MTKLTKREHARAKLEELRAGMLEFREWIAKATKGKKPATLKLAQDHLADYQKKALLISCFLERTT